MIPKKIINALLTLLRTSLWDSPIELDKFPIDEMEWKQLYAMARRHAIHTLIFDSLSYLPAEYRPPKETLAKWLLETQNAEKENAWMRKVLEAQNKSWNEHDIHAVLMKGESISRMYPHPEHRLYGDIDWYFPTGQDWSYANVMAIKAGSTPQTDSDGDTNYVWKDVVVEHHRNWVKLASKSGMAFIKSLEHKYAFMGEIETLSPELDLTLINTHILKHALVMGVGLRQVCDLAMAYRFYSGRLDTELYKAIIRKCGLVAWTDLLHTLLVSTLGMPEHYLPYELHDRDTTKIFQLILKDGNFGGRANGKLRSLSERFFLFMRYAPVEYFSRIWNLAIGRIKR